MDDSSRNYETVDSSSEPDSPTDRRRKLSIASDRSAGTEYVNVDDCSTRTTPVAYSDADVCIHDSSRHDDYVDDHIDDNAHSDSANIEEYTVCVNAADAKTREQEHGDANNNDECESKTEISVDAEHIESKQCTEAAPKSITPEEIDYTAQNGGPSAITNGDQTSGETSNTVKQTDYSIEQNPCITGIVYDETKPKRLPSRKKMHLDVPHYSDKLQDPPDVTIQSSIGILISPDEPDSPSRSRRRDYDRDNYQKISMTEETHTPYSPHESSPNQLNNVHLAEMNNTHYEKSPETKRRSRVRKNTNPYLTSPMERHRSPSPVERRLVTKHEAAVSSTVHKTRRKSSSDAGPICPNDRMKLPPLRKVSSGARLEDSGLELPRKRKVSFDTTALYNGNAMMPLNDYTTAVSDMPEYYEDSDDELIGEHCTTPGLSNLPTFVLSASDDELYDDSYINKASNQIRKVPTEENLNANCFVNESFVNDEGDNHFDASLSPGYHEYATIPNKGKPSSPSSYSPYANHETDGMHHLDSPYRNKLGHQKISTSSLPTGFGFRNGSNTSLEPKSILKIRKDDSESVASEESLAMKNFKVRRDSIALFAGQRGDLAMQAVVEQRSSKLKCLNKDYFKQIWVDRRHLYEKYKLHILVLILFTLTFAFVVVGLHFHKDQLSIAKQIIFDVKSRRLSLTDTNRNDTIWSTLGLNIPAWQQPIHCHKNYAEIDDRTCLKWKGYAQLDIVHYIVNRTKCYNVTWHIEDGDIPPHDCFDIGSSVWYGPTNISETQWPIKSSNFTFSVTNSKHYGSGTFSSAVEYYWLSTSGEAIILDSNFPLEINWNTEKRGKLCVKGRESGDFYYTETAQSNKFSYSICNGIDIHDTHMMVRNSFLSPVSKLPERWLIEDPHWSSVWDSDTINVNESLVADLAEDINSFGLSCGTIDIDGKWESVYGDMVFNPYLFTNVSDTIAAVSRAGCKVSLNVYPYFHFDSKNFQYGVTHGYFVKDVGKSVPALLKWQHGIAAMVDISNPQAQDWISSKLRKLLQTHDIDALRFTYGTASWVPHNPVFYADSMNPNTLKHMFSDAFSSIGHVITQSTSQSQHLTGLIAISSSVITRNKRVCLKNIIPDILNLGLMGYPFVISDGFSVDDKFKEADYVLPSRDVYVRWMQLSAFLPAMRFTIKPWVYDELVLAYAKNISSLHETVITQSIYDSTESILNGEPVIRPMWWVNPTDQSTFDIDDQFMITDKYMVAPILCEIQSDQGESFRDIYVPDGIWRDLSGTQVIVGGKWLRNYKVGLFEIPVFVKLSEYGESST